MPEQIKTPKQKGLEIHGELSGFDPCNQTVEFKVPSSPSKPGLIISVHGGGGKNDSQIEIKYIENMAHGGFTKSLNISTRDFGRGTIGWSEGGTSKSRKQMMSIISDYLSERSQDRY